MKGIRTRKICSSNVEDGLLEHCDFLNAKLEIKVHVYWWINISTSLPGRLCSGKTTNKADLLSM